MARIIDIKCEWIVKFLLTSEHKLEDLTLEVNDFKMNGLQVMRSLGRTVGGHSLPPASVLAERLANWRRLAPKGSPDAEKLDRATKRLRSLTDARQRSRPPQVGVSVKADQPKDSRRSKKSEQAPKAAAPKASEEAAKPQEESAPTPS